MKIAVSACLLGEACRYDGRAKTDETVAGLAESHELVPVCSEVLGGLPIPRTRCELQVMGDAECAAFSARVRVVDELGVDKTDAFSEGARKAVAAAQEAGCELAVLKSKSPSCGSGQVYDGTFSGALVPGEGVAARAFREAGIRVVTETQLRELLAKGGLR